ncbi:MAG TPA: metalloregulator ArsR/SmtB family transcription factor [Acidimicrobiia bacterium]|jgi:DNA-binding transcriptional ArsR family regulator|nr:metalloregulator ArsR/SmtB family transcription factor [Acidimicrobiia bacterium]
MARAATTTDAFNAVAEPRRREILDVLADGERTVNEIVEMVGLSQPLVSRHLRILRQVGLVRSRAMGRNRFYRLDATALQPIHAWVTEYERHWNERLDRLDSYLDDLQREETQ